MFYHQNHTNWIVQHYINAINVIIANVVKLNVLSLAYSQHLVDELKGRHVGVTFTVHYQPVAVLWRRFVCHWLGKDLKQTLFLHN